MWRHQRDNPSTTTYQLMAQYGRAHNFDYVN